MGVAILGTSCTGGDAGPPPAPGVQRALAEERARTIDELRYEVSLEIPEARIEPIRGRVTASFELAVPPASPLVFDFAQPADRVLAVAAGGAPATYRVADEHLVVAPETLRAGGNEVAIDFLAGDGSLNRNDDYLYTLFVPDRARVALPVFDQPDLKARFELRLAVPAGWRAVANGELVEIEPGPERQVYRFAPTEPIPTYLFAFAAGRFEVETAERRGRTLNLYHRETDRGKLERNREAIFDLHAAALDWLEEYTGIPYPFAKLDFVAVPAFQYGGMEHPGAIFYRDRSLFLDPAATRGELLGRASLIAHETAHMWFGNLVTMEWFDDVWMKEVFANFMAAKIVNPSFPEIDHELRFLLAHYPSAYRVDRTAGTHPIRQELENLDRAGSLYGAIIYQKAPIAMRHLELLTGEEAFRAAVRRYLDAHRYGNAGWPHLVAELDAEVDEDLRAWSGIWVEGAGRPTVRAELDVAGGTVAALRLRQEDPFGQGRVWSQRLTVRLGYAGSADRTIGLHLRRPEVEVAEARGLPAPDFVLANGAGVGYGRFVLDPRSLGFLLESLPKIDDATVRATAWISLRDAMLEGEVRPASLVDLALRALESEDDELLVEHVLGFLTAAYWRYLPTALRNAVVRRAEELLWRLLGGASEARLKAVYLAAYRELASSPGAVARLRRLWAGEETIDGLPLEENDLVALAQGLAVRGVGDAEAILDAQLARIENPDRRARFEFERPALSADPAVRRRFFDSLAEAANREHEPWVLSALGFLHHPLRAASAVDTIRPALEMLEEIQRTGDIFFPLGWLSAILDGHRSAEAAGIVRGFLEERPDLPPRLRGKLLQAADPLFRAAAIGDGE